MYPKQPQGFFHCSKNRAFWNFVPIWRREFSPSSGHPIDMESFHTLSIHHIYIYKNLNTEGYIYILYMYICIYIYIFVYSTVYSKSQDSVLRKSPVWTSKNGRPDCVLWSIHQSLPYQPRFSPTFWRSLRKRQVTKKHMFSGQKTTMQGWVLLEFGFKLVAWPFFFSGDFFWSRFFWLSQGSPFLRWFESFLPTKFESWTFWPSKGFLCWWKIHTRTRRCINFS